MLLAFHVDNELRNIPTCISPLRKSIYLLSLSCRIPPTGFRVRRRWESDKKEAIRMCCSSLDGGFTVARRHLRRRKRKTEEKVVEIDSVRQTKFAVDFCLTLTFITHTTFISHIYIYKSLSHQIISSFRIYILSYLLRFLI